MSTVLTFLFGLELTGVVLAAWVGVALVTRSAYRRAHGATASRSIAAASGAGGIALGILGGWLVADVLWLMRSRISGRRVWSWAAGFTWLAAFTLCEFWATDIAQTPQANQRAGVLVLSWLPIVPLFLAGSVAGLLNVISRRDRVVTLTPKVLFWTSLLLLFLVLPKPP